MPADELKVNDPLGRSLLTPLRTFSRPKSRLVTTKCCSEKGRVFRSPGVSSKSPISCTRSWGDGDTKPVAHASERLYEVIPSHREQTKETVWVIQVVLDGIPCDFCPFNPATLRSNFFISVKDDVNTISRNRERKGH